MPINVVAWHGEQSKVQHKARAIDRAIDRFFTRLIPQRRQVRTAQTGLAGPGQIEFRIAIIVHLSGRGDSTVRRIDMGRM
jgi:hypothetical protein